MVSPGRAPSAAGSDAGSILQPITRPRPLPRRTLGSETLHPEMSLSASVPILLLQSATLESATGTYRWCWRMEWISSIGRMPPEAAHNVSEKSHAGVSWEAQIPGKCAHPPRDIPERGAIFKMV